MVQLPTKRNWGRATENQYPLLVRQLDTMYGDITNVITATVKKNVVESQSPPADNPVNKNFNVGDIWVRSDTNTAWIMTSRANANAVTWTQIT